MAAEGPEELDWKFIQSFGDDASSDGNVDTSIIWCDHFEVISLTHP
jgi:hypothetical protein